MGHGQWSEMDVLKTCSAGRCCISSESVVMQRGRNGSLSKIAIAIARVVTAELHGSTTTASLHSIGTAPQAIIFLPLASSRYSACSLIQAATPSVHS